MRNGIGALALLVLALPAVAADEPSIKLGATIFADFTQQTSPTTRDVDGNEVHPSSFNVSRAYINITGNLNKRISFRITPDVARETGSGSSLTGSQNFRLKYAFVQLGLDDWMSKGSWARFGVQQTPFLDATEAIYRYRFQGTLFPEREGYLASSDAGVSLRYALPREYGDIHAGIYNGEGYQRTETNDQKGLQLRASVRPFATSALWKGLRTTVFYTGDHYVEDAKRERLIGQVTFEHKRAHAGFDVMSTKDRSSVTKPQLDGRGWSVWATPRLGKGWELLLRHDENRPDDDSDVRRRRDIAGVAYWVPDLQKVAVVVMADYDSLQVTNLPPDTRYALKMMVNF